MLHFLGQGQGAGRPDRAGQGPSVRLSVCLAGQGRGQGRVRLSVCLSVLQGRAGGRVRLSVCLSCRTGQGAGQGGQGRGQIKSKR